MGVQHRVRWVPFATGVATVLVVLLAGAAGPVEAATADCPNGGLSGFRPYLTDCRAYELVTPSYTSGASVRSLSAISASGLALIGISFGGFAGTGNDEIKSSLFGGAVYRFMRDDSAGWLTEPLSPPETMVSHSEYVAASTDDVRTLWGFIDSPNPPTSESPPEKELLNVGGRYHLVMELKEPGTPASFEPVGPEDSPEEAIPEENFALVGVSSDLSHILYTIKAENQAVWPGDKTEEGQPSLYEYVGTGNSEPSLVGVGNNGKLIGDRHVNERAQLISSCGTVLGSPVEKYNAISQAGSVVVFTALACANEPPVNEVYVRLAEEKTVAISEPVHPLLQGKGTGLDECDATCEGGTREGAKFVGASDDGSEIFFMTTQSLLNGDEEGVGRGNDLYEADLAHGALVRITQVSRDLNPGQAAEVIGVPRVSANGARVYFIAHGVLATDPNGEGDLPMLGADNLYVYDTTTKELRFVATLAAGDSQDWAPLDLRRPFVITPNGEFAVFLSLEKLTGSEDTSTVAQLFEYNAATGHIARASIGHQSPTGYFCPITERLEQGYNCNGNTSNGAYAPRIAMPSYLVNDMPTMATSALSLTSDGRVFFTSLNALAPESLEGSKNIYEYSAGNLFLVSVGEDPTMERVAFGESSKEEGRLVSTDGEGMDVFFGAVGSLLPQDASSQASIYDARVGGGFAVPMSALACEGESCRAGGSASPSILAPPTSAFLTGESDVAQQKPKGKVKRRNDGRALARALRRCEKRPKSVRRRCRKTAHGRYRARMSTTVKSGSDQ